MKFLKRGLAAILLIGLACGAVAAEVTDRIIAVVNDEVITLAELNRGFEPYAQNIEANYKGNDKEATLQQNKKVFLQRLIDQLLIEQQAKKAGAGFTAVSDEEVMNVVRDMLAKNNLSMENYVKKLAAEGNSLEAVKKEIRGQMLRMRLLRREVQSKIVITDEEIGDFYDKHRQDYEGAEAVRIKQILLPVAAGADNKTRESVKAQARQLRENISKGEPFEILAAQYSKGPAAAQGGDIGFVERGVMVPEVEKAAFSLPAGQVSEVIETEMGFHIIAVVDKRGAGLKPLPMVRNEIKAKIEDEKVAKKYDEWMEDLRKKSFIDVRL
ncbi:MAG TPA: peptidylprolyl isomerase [Smithellaceae bacterium]|nr:peptidylprolyl isomerase [Smithellaceae bacterium]